MKNKDIKFAKLLIEWIKLNKRDFSWRRKLTPFQMLVAEMMLQKTGANQVEKIFPEFIKLHPDPESIVRMEEEDLARELKPLGLFNRRARDLKKMAQNILENENDVPSSRDDLMKLPGVGAYIANAVLSFVFDKPTPIVDGNVGRIMKRVFSFPVKGAPSRDKKLAVRMEQLIPEKEHQDFNYGMLDLGALICLPRKPRCEECPLLTICDFRQENQ